MIMSDILRLFGIFNIDIGLYQFVEHQWSNSKHKALTVCNTWLDDIVNSY